MTNMPSKPLSRSNGYRFSGLGLNRAFSSPSPLSEDDLRSWQLKRPSSVKSGMVLGLGTSSTPAFVVIKIGELLASGELKDIVAIPTSKRTEEQAGSLGIPLFTLNDHHRLDLAIDGADEVDPKINLVKGCGDALLCEKMVETVADQFVVVVDESKLVTGLGGSGLAMPVEVVQFCWEYDLDRLQELFEVAKLRLYGDGKPYETDKMNYIVDWYFKTPMKDLHLATRAIINLGGVVEHGLFLQMTDAAIVKRYPFERERGFEGIFVISPGLIN